MFKKGLCFVLAICVSAMCQASTNQLFQVATIGALARGVYDSDYTYVQLMSHGSQGLGTFGQLDGEMIAVDHHYFQINSNGRVTEAAPEQTVPFAEVVDFKPVATKKLTRLDNYAGLKNTLLSSFANNNVPYAFRIDGSFKSITMRSLRKQEQPYKNLLEASKNQALFELGYVKGTIVGFWFPEYWTGIAVPGFHLHFINAEHSIGGHVLSIDLSDAMLSYAPMYEQSFRLPRGEAFAMADLNPVRLHSSIKKAEG